MENLEKWASKTPGYVQNLPKIRIFYTGLLYYIPLK